MNKNTRRWIFAACALPLAGPAAADFTGPYVGGTFGYATGRAQTDVEPLPNGAAFVNLAPTMITPKPNGPLWARTAATTWQRGRLVYGAELDYMGRRSQGHGQHHHHPEQRHPLSRRGPGVFARKNREPRLAARSPGLHPGAELARLRQRWAWQPAGSRPTARPTSDRPAPPSTWHRRSARRAASYSAAAPKWAATPRTICASSTSTTTWATCHYRQSAVSAAALPGELRVDGQDQRAAAGGSTTGSDAAPGCRQSRPFDALFAARRAVLFLRYPTRLRKGPSMRFASRRGFVLSLLTLPLRRVPA